MAKSRKTLGKKKALSANVLPAPPLKSAEFDAAYTSLSARIGKRKGDAQKLKSLEEGKRLLEGALLDPQVSVSHAQEYCRWLENGVDELGLPPVPRLNYCLAVLGLLQSCIASKEKAEGKDAEEGIQRLAIMVASVAEHVKHLVDDDNNDELVPLLCTKEWIKLLGVLLQQFDGGRKGAPDTSGLVCDVLWLIVSEDAAGLCLLLQDDVLGCRMFGDILFGMESASTSLTLFRIANRLVISADAKERDSVANSLVSDNWSTSTRSKLVRALLSNEAPKGNVAPKYFYKLINDTLEDKTWQRPRGFQFKAFSVNGESKIENDKCQRRLQSHQLFVYIDRWVLLFKPFGDSGFEEDFTFPFERIVDFEHGGKGAFTFSVRPRCAQASAVAVEFAIYEDQIDEFMECAMKNASTAGPAVSTEAAALVEAEEPQRSPGASLGPITEPSSLSSDEASLATALAKHSAKTRGSEAEVVDTPRSPRGDSPIIVASSSPAVDRRVHGDEPPAPHHPSDVIVDAHAMVIEAAPSLTPEVDEAVEAARELHVLPEDHDFTGTSPPPVGFTASSPSPPPREPSPPPVSKTGSKTVSKTTANAPHPTTASKTPSKTASKVPPSTTGSKAASIAPSKRPVSMTAPQTPSKTISKPPPSKAGLKTTSKASPSKTDLKTPSKASPSKTGLKTPSKASDAPSKASEAPSKTPTTASSKSVPKVVLKTVDLIPSPAPKVVLNTVPDTPAKSAPVSKTSLKSVKKTTAVASKAPAKAPSKTVPGAAPTVLPEVDSQSAPDAVFVPKPVAMAGGKRPARTVSKPALDPVAECSEPETDSTPPPTTKPPKISPSSQSPSKGASPAAVSKSKTTQEPESKAVVKASPTTGNAIKAKPKKEPSKVAANVTKTTGALGMTPTKQPATGRSGRTKRDAIPVPDDMDEAMDDASMVVGENTPPPSPMFAPSSLSRPDKPTSMSSLTHVLSSPVVGDEPALFSDLPDEESPVDDDRKRRLAKESPLPGGKRPSRREALLEYDEGAEGRGRGHDDAPVLDDRKTRRTHDDSPVWDGRKDRSARDESPAFDHSPVVDSREERMAREESPAVEDRKKRRAREEDEASAPPPKKPRTAYVTRDGSPPAPTSKRSVALVPLTPSPLKRRRDDPDTPKPTRTPSNKSALRQPSSEARPVKRARFEEPDDGDEVAVVAETNGKTNATSTAVVPAPQSLEEDGHEKEMFNEIHAILQSFMKPLAHVMSRKFNAPSREVQKARRQLVLCVQATVDDVLQAVLAACDARAQFLTELREVTLAAALAKSDRRHQRLRVLCAAAKKAPEYAPTLF